MIVAKKISIEAGHWLPNHPGKCSRHHGHRWIVEVAVSGRVDAGTGMVVDFTHLKEFLGIIETTFDHTDINDTIPNPTAENIALWIQESFEEYACGSSTFIGIKLAWIKVWETEDSMAMLEGK